MEVRVYNIPGQLDPGSGRGIGSAHYAQLTVKYITHPWVAWSRRARSETEPGDRILAKTRRS